MNNVLVVGSVALDTIETPSGRQDGILGGSAIHFALAARHFARVQLVGVVGQDFPEEHVTLLRRLEIDLTGLEKAEGQTFRWHGRYKGAMNVAQTVSVELNTFGTFRPTLPQGFRGTQFLLLGNASPHTQAAVLDQMKGPKFVLLDTMNLWIQTECPALVDLAQRVHALCVNDEEARMLARTPSFSTAIRKILEMGITALIVKKGEHGAILATRDFRFVIPAFPTETVVDPTGAGDSFAGGFLGYLAGVGVTPSNLRKALLYGAVMGSFTVESFGTERGAALTRSEVDARYHALCEMISL